MNSNNNFIKAVHDKDSKDLDKSSKDNNEDEIETCPHGYKNCNEDDFESMCDGCKQERGEAHNDAQQDTYD